MDGSFGRTKSAKNEWVRPVHHEYSTESWSNKMSIDLRMKGLGPKVVCEMLRSVFEGIELWKWCRNGEELVEGFAWVQESLIFVKE
ncbi:hypothetical protein E3N88_35089 [Mikania micrantha]|uniref:Uncharacterized protein n=1 Tax=Mikania micrantha TaxID=192012 RepID=A0A5N6LZZ3_9ASTR|nr:hypothetical protein E3N88_35089 [Mikania micrantha]